jgi:uncharacterized protein YjbJ (UPF0337 family)
MDRERIKGSAQQAGGAMKESAGRLTGDEKLKAEGKLDKVEGKMRSAVGGAKDTIREAHKEAQKETHKDDHRDY